MAELSAADLVDLIVKRAPELRQAGVLDIAIGDFRASLAPHQEPMPVVAKTDQAAPVDPLLDPRTYGLTEGAKLPGPSHLEIIEVKAGGKAAR